MSLSDCTYLVYTLQFLLRQNTGKSYYSGICAERSLYSYEPVVYDWKSCVLKSPQSGFESHPIWDSVFFPKFACRERTEGTAPWLFGLFRLSKLSTAHSLKTKSALGQTKSLRDDISAFAATISAHDV